MSRQEMLPADYTICAYVRLSTEDDDISGFKVESGSITSQRKLIMDFIKRQPEFARCNVIERCDDGYSGTRFDDRPQFTDMISLARQGKINCIIVKDCSRFGRDYVELGDYLEQLFPFLGVRFISINDGYDSDKEEAGLDIAFKNLVYDLYARDASKKGKITMKRMAKQGKYLGPQVLYGYRKSKTDKHKLEKDPETAPVVREIFDAKLAGVGNTEIARCLNDRGVLCPTAYLVENGRSVVHKQDPEKMCWTGSVVSGILQNEIYTGTMVGLKRKKNRHTGKLVKRADKDVIRVDDTHEGIVTKEEFMAVQDSINEQAPHGKRKYPVHYHCGICGKRLARMNKMVHCLKEYAYTESPCEGVRIIRQDADEAVLNQLKEKLQRILKREEMNLKKMQAAVPGADQIRAAEKKLETLSAERKKLCDKMLDRSIDREVFRKKKAELDEQIAMQKRWLAGLKAAEDFAEIEERIEEMMSFLDINEMTEEVWDRFVEKVVVFPDKRLEIHWNFEE